ncbi:MAG TPA: hypothetical protein VFC44_13600 [Candidatus Saccharimonadales bacterium]|nr:hypothetical protein [Candidatus Saccharimonadales bacterium]
MKTPREVLLARHQSAAPKLNGIRHQVIDRPGPAADFLPQLWREVFWPCRRVWAGLAVVWALIVLVNVSQRDGSPPPLAEAPPTAEMMMAFRNEEKLLNDLLSDHPQPVDALRPQEFVPKPRSEIDLTAIV